MELDEKKKRDNERDKGTLVDIGVFAMCILISFAKLCIYFVVVFVRSGS
jgi:hypothetical protein